MMRNRRLTYLKQLLPIATLLLGGIALSGCSSDQPDTIYYGQDACAHCTMLITDERFAAELKTSKGRAFKFDAIECMAAYSNNHADQLDGAHLWVKNFAVPEQWILVNEALFLQSPDVKSPMGLSLLATESREEMDQLQQEFGGQTMNWSEVKQMVEDSWD